MPVPLVPLAAGAALAALALVRLRAPRIDQRGEDALDAAEEGLALGPAKGRDQTSAAGRLRRVVRLRPDGPGVEIDAAFLARLRIRKV